jgi:hypothetical protein
MGQGLIVIGQDVWERDGLVEPFVKKMGDKMIYRVAWTTRARRQALWRKHG